MRLLIENYSKFEYSFNETWRYELFTGVHNFIIDKDDLNFITVYRR